MGHRIKSRPQRYRGRTVCRGESTDIRRVKSVKKIVETMAVHPGRSIPQRCRSHARQSGAQSIQTRGSHPREHSGKPSGLGATRCDSPGSLCYWNTQQSLHGSGNKLLRVSAPLVTAPQDSRVSFLHTVLSVRCPTPAGQPQTSACRGDRPSDQQYMCGRHVASPESPRKSGSNALASPQSGPQPVTAWGVPGRRAVGQGRRREADIDAYLAVVRNSATVFNAGCQRSCLKPSRDGEAYWTIIPRGTQRRPFGRVYLRVTPKAKTPCAHGALVRECHRRDVKCSLASRICGRSACPISCTAVRVWEVAAQTLRQAGMAPVV